MSKYKKITIVGCGYVGTSLGVLFARNHLVTFFDNLLEKIDQINNFISPIPEEQIQKNFDENKENINATTSKEKAYKDADFIIIATPTNFDERIGGFDTSSVESVLDDINKINKDALVVIKSTIPIGFTKQMQSKFSNKNIIFSPEFLREGKTIEDNQNPSRIVIGSKSKKGKLFAELLMEISIKKDINILFTNSSEAEAIKLFSNSYLAMRISFFNELDNFAIDNKLSSEEIIKGVSSDKRISDLYNNPSFGYGGYCLPKDTQQLNSNFAETPHHLINMIHSSNEARKDFLVKEILSRKANFIGIYRLQMKKESTNFRDASVIGIIDRLIHHKIDIFIYEPLLKEDDFRGCIVIKDLQTFKDKTEVILANRLDQELQDVRDKVFTRDIFQVN